MYSEFYAYLGVRLPSILIGISVSLTFNFILLFIFSLSTKFVAGIVSLGLIGGLLGSLLSRNHAVQVVTTEMAPSGKGFRRGLLARGAAVLGTGVLMGVGAGLIMAPNLSLDAPNLRVAFGELIGLGSILLALLMKPGTPAQSSSGATGTSAKSLWYAFLHSQHARNGWLVGSIIGLSLVLSYVLALVLRWGLDYVNYILSDRSFLTSILAIGLIIGLLFGLMAVLLSLILADRSGAIQPVERLAWSWKSLWRSLTNAEHLKNVLRVGISLS